MKITVHSGFRVIRGDINEGGFKAFAIGDLFNTMNHNKYVFSSNSVGYGPLALSQALKDDRSREAIIFLSKYDKCSDNTERCRQYGARVLFEGESEPWDSVGLREEAIIRFEDKNTYIVPSGLEHPVIKENIQRIISSLFPDPPSEFWMACGSGFTIRAIQEIWPNTEFNGVCVRGNNPDIGNAKIYIPSERFFEQARLPPPYKSSPYYDAKVWAFVQTYGRSDAVILNVA